MLVSNGISLSQQSQQPLKETVNTHQIDPRVTTIFKESTSISSVNDEDLQKKRHGFDAFDRAVHQGDVRLAKEIMRKNMAREWVLLKEACKHADEIDKNNPGHEEMLAFHEGEDIDYVCSHGYSGHQNMLTRAIRLHDVKSMVRLCMNREMGLWFTHQDPNTKKTLLHNAVDAANGEAIYFLLTGGIDQEIQNSDGLTPRQLAEKNHRTDLVELIDHINLIIARKEEEIEKFSPEMTNKLNWIINNVESYIEKYKEVRDKLFDEKGELNEEGKAFQDFAIHGLVSHTENSQGHHGLVLNSIIEGNLERLVAYAKKGASLNTISLPWQRALEDPLGFEPYFRFANDSLKESLTEMRETFAGEDPTVWEKEPGMGKSLLDIAVLYSTEEKNNLAIIAYLLSKGLDPWRTNDDGECAFSLALIKGNLQAASLMMSYNKISSEKAPVIDEESLDRTFQLLQKGSQLRDPLYINTTKSTAALFAMPGLLSLVVGNNEGLSLLTTLSFILSCFLPDMTTYREKLLQKPTPPLYMPDAVKAVYPWFSKASILEIAILPEYAYGRLGTSAVGIYSGVMSTFATIKTAFQHVNERPLQAMYKVSSDALPLIQSCIYFKYAFNSLILRPLSKLNLVCEEVDSRKYTHLNISEKLKTSLNPQCKEHAKILLAKNWSQTDFESNPNAYMKKVVQEIPFEDLSQNEKIKTIEAYFTLNESESSLLKDTAIKLGVVWGLTKAKLNIWPLIGGPSMIYRIGEGVYRSIRG